MRVNSALAVNDMAFSGRLIQLCKERGLIMYELYVKQKTEVGIKAAEEGRAIPHDQVKARILARHQKHA